MLILALYPKWHSFKIEVCDEISQTFFGDCSLLPKSGPVLSLFEFNIDLIPFSYGLYWLANSNGKHRHNLSYEMRAILSGAHLIVWIV